MLVRNNLTILLGTLEDCRVMLLAGMIYDIGDQILQETEIGAGKRS